MTHLYRLFFLTGFLWLILLCFRQMVRMALVRLVAALAAVMLVADPVPVAGKMDCC